MAGSKDTATASAKQVGSGFRRLLIGALSVGVLLLGGAAVLLLPHKLRPNEVVMLRKYESIREALARDDLELAQKQAEELAAGGDLRVAEPAISLSKSNSLYAARTQFKRLSSVAVKLARNQEGYYILRCEEFRCLEKCTSCPMEQYGEWVQVARQAENPFMGKAKIHCGSVEL